MQRAGDIHVPLPLVGVEYCRPEIQVVSRIKLVFQGLKVVFTGDVSVDQAGARRLANRAVLARHDHIVTKAVERDHLAAPIRQVEAARVGFVCLDEDTQGNIQRQDLPIDLLAEAKCLVVERGFDPCLVLPPFGADFPLRAEPCQHNEAASCQDDSGNTKKLLVRLHVPDGWRMKEARRGRGACDRAFSSAEPVSNTTWGEGDGRHQAVPPTAWPVDPPVAGPPS